MTDGTQNEENTKTPEALAAEELSLLKGRAKQMGLTFHPKIGIEKLKAKIQNRLDGATDTAEPLIQAPIDVPETKLAMHARLRREASKLVRIRVACMNPNKKEYDGEIFTVSNSVVGTYKKYVDYNNEDGWHVPHIIYEHLKERKCQIFYTVKGPRGNKIRKGKMINEFAIEVLTPLTGEQISDLATKQAMANNLD